jgi:UDP-N-acetylmuramoylalanine--D-glutamate ligase
MTKEEYLPFFESKKVTVLGLGLLGRGVGDTKFLAEAGADVIVTDLKSKEELAASLESLKDCPNITYHLGGHEEADFVGRDFILKAAGVPLDSPYILKAEAMKVPVYMSAALVCDTVMKHVPDVVIVGVTGTRGKSTTTELIAHILRENGSRVHLGGNVRGVANLPLLNDIEEGDFLVLELDSWQLQGFGDMNISPHIAVFTSFLDDHMSYYKNDKEAYFNDKANIYRHQHEGDVLIASPQAASEIIMREKKIAITTPDDNTFEMKLIGEHNVMAARLAYEAASQCGLDDEGIRNSIKTFAPVHGRLEDVGVCKGVRVFNDNNATTPDATIAGIKAIEEKYSIKPILIVGGSDKGLTLASLEDTINEHTKHAVYLSGTGTAKLSTEKTYEYERLEDCVMKAFDLAKEGDIILFSPAFASFSTYFKNEYERNDEFVKVVQKYA